MRRVNVVLLGPGLAGYTGLPASDRTSIVLGFRIQYGCNYFPCVNRATYAGLHYL